MAGKLSSGALGARRALSSVTLVGVLMAVGMAVAAIFFGLLSVTESPMLIAVGVALIMGPVLLLRQDLTVWVILVVGFLMGVLSANPQLGKVTWIVSMLSTLLLLPALINMLWTPERKLPGFLRLALLFLFFSILTSAVNWYSLQEFVGGFKRYFQAYGLMLALTLIAFTPEHYARWRKFLYIIALLQLPFALYELLVLVPMRGGIGLSSETTDVVAGTFGANLEGGSPNSVMVMFLFIAMAFLTARWRAGLLGNRLFYVSMAICFLPLGMGETKFAVVLLPIVGLSLLRIDILRNPVKFLPTIIGLCVVTAVLGYIYVVLMMRASLGEVIDSTLRYNVGEQGYSKTMVLNRMTSLTFWFSQQHWNDPVSFLVGNGLGSSYTSTGTVIGHMGAKYLQYGINLTAASTILWDTGVIGLAMYIGIFVAAWFAAGKLYKQVDDPGVRADALAIQACNVIFLFSLIYSDSIVNLVSMELIYAVVLGYLGYLMNHHKVLEPKFSRARKRPAHGA